MIKKILNKNCMLVLALGLLAGCSSGQVERPESPKSTLTQGAIEIHLKKGVTTKTKVLETMGAPNITSLDSNGNDVWTYQRHSSVANSSSSSSYGTIILFGGSQNTSGLESSQKTMTLVIKFNDKGIVKDFKSQFTSF